MRDSLRVGSIVFVLLMVAGACAEDKVSLPDPVPEPVRMADIGPAGGGADMTMAAGPDDTSPNVPQTPKHYHQKKHHHNHKVEVFWVHKGPQMSI